ncbi:MAG: hypothetical protein BAJATHORv1_80014 [Candidatus Thorarchaeota archaeon]|nr:MAG: hypothetical protein BAJATHORv1_80014 [Candidatus Thorarchaeota archaeon]
MTELARQTVTSETLNDWILAYNLGSKSRSTSGSISEIELRSLIEAGVVSIDEFQIAYNGVKPASAIRLRFDENNTAHLSDISVRSGHRKALYHLLDATLLQCRNNGISRVSTWTTASASHTSDVLSTFVFDVEWINVQLKSNLIGVKNPESNVLPDGFYLEEHTRMTESDISTSVLDKELDLLYRQFKDPLFLKFQIYNECIKDPVVTALAQRGMNSTGWLKFSPLTDRINIEDYSNIVSMVLSIFSQERVSEVRTEIDAGSPLKKLLQILGLRPILTLFNMTFTLAY